MNNYLLPQLLHLNFEVQRLKAFGGFYNGHALIKRCKSSITTVFTQLIDKTDFAHPNTVGKSFYHHPFR